MRNQLLILTIFLFTSSVLSAQTLKDYHNYLGQSSNQIKQNESDKKITNDYKDWTSFMYANIAGYEAHLHFFYKNGLCNLVQINFNYIDNDGQENIISQLTNKYGSEYIKTEPKSWDYSSKPEYLWDMGRYTVKMKSSVLEYSLK